MIDSKPCIKNPISRRTDGSVEITSRAVGVTMSTQNTTFMGNSLTALTNAWEQEQIPLLHRWFELLHDPTATPDQLDEIDKAMDASTKKYIDATNEIINASTR